MKHEKQLCIEHCQKCHAICLQMALTHCLEVGGKHIEPYHLRLMMDCAQICQTHLDFMLRDSPHQSHVARECCEICQQCATSCDTLEGMEECARICRFCAESCRTMSHLSS